jgi:protein-tyrosine phosphatase
MAEGLARWAADLKGRRVEARSAGTLGIEARPAEPHAVSVCAEIGVDIAGHRSQGLTDELVDWADYLVVMEVAHAAHLREKFPSVGERIVLLGSFGGVYEVPDPMGGWKFQFRGSRDTLRRCVETFVERLPPAPSRP